jgi:hypothetical protein
MHRIQGDISSPSPYCSPQSRNHIITYPYGFDEQRVSLGGITKDSASISVSRIVYKIAIPIMYLIGGNGDHSKARDIL